MNDLGSRLERECRTFATYLVGTPPNSYVCAKYVETHDHALQVRSHFDRLLLSVARRGALGAKLADSYARVFCPQALLRKKLVLLLAILETCSPSYHLIDDLDSNSPTVLVLRMSARAIGSLVALAAAVPFLLPAQLILTPISKER